MTDVTKNVEIALKILGADDKVLKTLVTAFENIQKAVNEASVGIEKFKTKIESITVPSAMKDITASFKELNGVKFSNLEQMANGFEKLKGLEKNIPDLKPFATELEKFKNVGTLPNLGQIGEGFKKLSEDTKGDFANKIDIIVKNLEKFKNIGTLPNLGQIANGLKIIMETDLRGFNKKIDATVLGLEKLAKVDLTNLAIVLKNLGSINLSKVTDQLKRTEKAIKDTGNAAQTSGSKISGFLSDLKRVATFRGISEILLFLKDAFTSGVSAIVDYDQALKDLQAITGATTLEVAQMGIKILEVASSTKFSASEIAEGMRIIAQAGFTANEAVLAMEAIANLATGTLSDMSTTVDLVTTAMRVFQIDASESAMISDVFANAVNKSKLTIDKLRTAMNYVGPIAKDAGVSFQELSAAMGTLANSGLRASTIGTGLRNVLARLISPNKQLIDAAKEAGISLSEIDPKTVGLKTALLNLGVILKDSSDAFEIFGKRGASAATALSNSGSQFDSLLSQINDSGSAARMASIQIEGLVVKFKNLKDKLEVLSITLGKAGIGAAFGILIDLARQLTEALTFLARSPLGQFVVVLGLVAIAVDTVALSLALLSAVTATASGGMLVAAGSAGMFATAIGLVNAGIASAIAMLGPWGAAALAALSGIVLLWTAFVNVDLNPAKKEVSLLADEYGNLTKQLQTHSVAVAGLAKEDEKLKEENLKLRNSLFRVANDYKELTVEARAAANSINAINGEIKDNSALEKYADTLATLQFEGLIEAGEAINTQWEKQNTIFGAVGRGINKLWSDLQTLGSSNPFAETTAESREFAKQIADGTVSVEELGKAIENWDMENLNVQQEESLVFYQRLIEQSQKWYNLMLSSGKITLEMTRESVEETAEKLGYTGRVLEGVMVLFDEAKKSAEGFYDTFLEKMGKEGVKNTLEMVDAYTKLNGVFKEGEEAAIRSSLAIIQSLADQQEVLKKTAEEAISVENLSKEDKLKIWDDYNEKVSQLNIKANLERSKLNKIATFENIKLLGTARAALEKTLVQNAKLYENDLKNLSKYNRIAITEYEATQKKLLSGQYSGDIKDQEIAFKNSLKDRETDHAQYIAKLIKMEADGAISTETMEIRKAAAELEFYKISMENANKHFEGLKEFYDDDTDEYQKGLTLSQEATKRYYEELGNYREKYSKINYEVEKANLNAIIALIDASLESDSKRQDARIKVAESNLKAMYEAKTITIKSYYDGARFLANKNADEDIARTIKHRDEKKKALDALIALEKSDKTVTEARTKAEIELEKIETALHLLEAERETALTNLTAAQDKDTEASKKRTDAMIEQVKALKTASAIDLNSDPKDILAKQAAEREAFEESKKLALDKLADELNTGVETEEEKQRQLNNVKEIWNQIGKNKDLKHASERLKIHLDNQDTEYKSLQEREALIHANRLKNIAELDEKGHGDDPQQTAKDRFQAEVDYRGRLSALAKKYYEESLKYNSPEDHAKRLNEKLKADKDYINALTDQIIELDELQKDLDEARIIEKYGKEQSALEVAMTKQQEAAKTALVEAKANYDMNVSNTKEYYDKLKVLAEQDLAAQLDNLEKKKAIFIAEMKMKIALAADDPIKKADLEKSLAEGIDAVEKAEIKAKEENARKLLAIEADRYNTMKDNAEKVNKLMEDTIRIRDSLQAKTKGSTLEEENDAELAEFDRKTSEIHRKMLESEATSDEIDEQAATRSQARAAMETAHEEAEYDLRLNNRIAFFSGMADIAKSAYEVGLLQGKKGFAVVQAFAVAESIMNTHKAASDALAEGGPIMGPIMAAIALAKGMLHVAAISKQKPPSYAEGGRIKGYSPSSKADNITIQATANEYMQPVKAVKHYGLDVMEGIRTLSFPKEIFKGFKNFSFPKVSYNLAGGGSVPDTPKAETATPQQPKQAINIFNVPTPGDLAEAMATPEGVNAIINAISFKRQTVRRILT